MAYTYAKNEGFEPFSSAIIALKCIFIITNELCYVVNQKMQLQLK